MERLRETFRIEKEEWQAQLLNKSDAEMKQRERALREKLINERDAEIELVIQRLESESNTSSSGLLRQHRLEIERLKAEHSEEVKQVGLRNYAS